ncbi:uncharacterized protein LOC126562559 [Anopheles maculipalpis]|uniref:uncharacterized protein LOC126562559 n=1 Tax=Anopheles maculipalpis TaxID=1496333 RepID=UPI00215918F0|nr:uncharacterized protein LOC126562559 [Anopheles maculipalpis]
MSDTNLMHLSALWRQLPHLTASLERTLWNTFRTYQPSWQTQQLASETQRELFVELVSFCGGGNYRPFDAMVHVTEDVAQDVPKRLSTIVLEFLVASFDGGPEPKPLSCCQVREFGSLLSTELPLVKVIDLESETYWRRVVWCYSNDALVYHEHDYLSPKRFWKQQGIELKLAQMIEQQDPQFWELEGLEDTIKKAAPFVDNLYIKQLKPHPTVEPIEEYEEYDICNAPDELCNHGSLTILGHLVNLTSLSLVFGVKHWIKSYQNRYSNCSSTDIENLGLGLQKLEKLKKFTLSQTRLNSPKLKILLDSVTPLQLETIRLTHCQLAAGCGAILGRFLSRFQPSLTHLDLSHNRFDATELDQLCPGLSVYRGAVDRLDLSYNPIGEAGVLILGGAMKGCAQLSELNFTGCQMGVEGSFRVIQLLSFHATLRKVSLNCVPISPEGGEKLVQVLLENTHIEDVQVRQCGLTNELLAKVRKILRKHAKIRDQPRSVKVNLNQRTDKCHSERSLGSMFLLERQIFSE